MKKEIEEYFLKRNCIAEDRVIEEIIRRGGLSYLIKNEKKINFNKGIISFEDLPLEKEFSILKEFNIRGYPGVSNTFETLFSSRLNTLRRALRDSGIPGFQSSIENARKINGEVGIIGLVREVNKIEGKITSVIIEDETDNLRVYLGKNIDDIILEDEVLGITGKFNNKKDVFYANSIKRPEARKERVLLERNSRVLVLSDIHVGSKKFLENEFADMIDYVNSMGISHVIMNGDLVDGIGIYPDQEKDLAINDIINQYKRLSQLISKINKNVRVILIPGNHDIVYSTEPQNPLPKEINDLFPQNVQSLSNPVWIEITGRVFLLYHGTSIMDFVEMFPGFSLNDSKKVMREMIKRRHLGPTFGRNLSFLPLREDFYIMDPIPDVFITGHIHDHSTDNYNGILTINASTFQDQTDYQRMMNFNPRPGLGTVVNTSDLSVEVIKFS